MNYVYLAMVGHLCTDINQGALPAIMPFLVQQYGFSYAQVGLLILVTNVVSVVIQPLFGWLGDRMVRPEFMALGVFLAGTGISLVGFTASFPLMLLFVSISGIGIAMFHPEGSKIANFAAADKKGAGMGIFGAGGNIGFTIGPILITLGISGFGMHGTWILVVPSLLCALFILKEIKGLKSLSYITKEKVKKSAAKDNWHFFSLMMAICSLRAIIFSACTTYIALYFLRVLHQTEDFSSLMLSIFAIVGAVATVVGGNLADKIGYKVLIVISYSFLTFILLGFLNQFSVSLGILVMVCAVIGLTLSFSSSIVLAQSYLPNHVGTASGLILGVAVSIGGICSPVLGKIADVFGLSAMFASLALLSALCTLLALYIPAKKSMTSLRRVGRN